MAFMEDLVKLRTKLTEAIRLGVIDDKNYVDMYQAALIQLMNEAERRRQECVREIDDLRRKLAVMEGEELAFARIGTMMFPILDGYIAAAQKAAREEADRAAEMAEKRQLIEDARTASEASASEAVVGQPPDEKKPRKRAPKARDGE